MRVDRAHADALDHADPLASYREQFSIPCGPDGMPVVYLCGNSLGLMPRSAVVGVQQELEDWARFGVEGHFRSRRPWFSYHEQFREPGARLVGALPGEVVMMNTLTVNLHLMMATFYRPSGGRTLILIESCPFPSDRYAMLSQARLHGLDPADVVVELTPRPDEATLRTEDIVAVIEERGDEIAVVAMSGVNYFTGQWFDMPAITRAARARGCVVGWDLAHAAGNVPLALHDWDVDFAVWCSYKYLNAGPGAVGGCFVHERHGRDRDLPRLAGWWGDDPATRFQMDRNRAFVPREGADGWQVSNPQIFSLAPLRASLELFGEAGMANLRDKSLSLTGYLEALVLELNADALAVITPNKPSARGCQLSLRVRGQGGEARALCDALSGAGVVLDFREPDVIRVAPAPLYNSYRDVWAFVDRLGVALGRDPLPLTGS